MTEEQFAKLPKWAQSEVTRLRRDLDEANKINRQNLGEYDPRFPAYGDYDAELRGRSLPCRQVWFRSVGITVRVGDKGGVHISGDGQLRVIPHVTNVLTVTCDQIDERP